ncbi:hypothetical protein CP10743SC13_1584 [Chlamydia psittaci 10_743_SC13]|nr:hypothetical protein CP10743SC13_1584 [Chlamydia psittaci 10_743_SC13]
MNNKRFLFANPPFKQKSHVFSLRIQHLTKITRFLFKKPTFNVNHAFFLHKSPI